MERKRKKIGKVESKQNKPRTKERSKTSKTYVESSLDMQSEQEKESVSKESVSERVIKNSFYNFFAVVINKIGALIFTIVVARMLFPELFGIYKLALVIILTIVTFTDLGINATLSRYLAESLKLQEKSKTKEAKVQAKKAEKQARARLFFLLNFKITLTILFSIVLFFTSKIIANNIFHKPMLFIPLQLGSIYLFVISIHGFFNTVFFALEKVKYSTINETIFQISRIIFVVLLFSFYKNVEIVFVSLIIALFLAFIFCFMIITKRFGFLVRGEIIKLAKEEKKRMLRFFGWLTISSVTLPFFAYMDTFMLGIFLPAEFVGYYNAVFSIVTATAAFITFGSLLLPIFTKLEKNQIERGFRKVFHYVAMLALPAALGLAFIIVPVIKIVYGQAYLPLEHSFAITITSILLSLLIIEAALITIYSALFQAKEKPKIPSILIIIITVLNLILNYAFIKIAITISQSYGLIAVALATVITRYTNLTALTIISKKKFNVKTKASSILKPLIASAIMLGFLFVFDHFIDLNVWTGILMIILAALVYFGIMWLIKGIKKEDIQIIKMLK